MKKSLVAVGVIVALGVIWTGGAWYTGKQVESRIADMVAQANQQLKQNAPEAGLEVSYQDYQRGVFSSQLKMVVKPIANAKDAWLAPGQSVVLDETISHGPFPLTAFNLSPALASIHSQLVKNDTTQHLFELAKEQSPFDINTRVSYSGETESALSLKPLDYAQGDDKVTFSGGEFQLSLDAQGNLTAINGEAKGGQINALNEYNQKVQFTFNNLKTTGSTQPTSFEERIGDQDLNIEQILVAVDDQPLAELNGMHIAGKTQLSADGKKINGQMDYSLNSLKLQKQDFGSGKLTIKVDDIDGAALHEFSQQYQSKAQALSKEIDITKRPDIYQQRAAEILLSTLPILLKGEPTIHVSPLSWKNAKGESTFNLSMALKDPAKATGKARTTQQILDRSMKSLDIKLAIPVPMATELMTQAGLLEGASQDEAAAQATQQVQGLSAMGKMFHITTTENDVIGSSLHYADGKVTLNGRTMTVEEFTGMFGLPDVSELQDEDVAPMLSPAQ